MSHLKCSEELSKEEKDLSYIRERVEHFTEFLDGFMISETDTRSEGFIVSTEEMDMDNSVGNKYCYCKAKK